MEKFDFSKIEDQDKFEKLPKKEQEEIKTQVQEEGVKMNADAEREKRLFMERYNQVISRAISPENIQEFCQNALDSLTALVDDISSSYRQYSSEALSGKELEDEAMRYFNMPDIPSILDALDERNQRIQNYRNMTTPQASNVIIPPSPSRKPIIAGSGNGMEEKQIIRRTDTLLYILANDLDIAVGENDNQEQNVLIREGRVAGNMMRKLPYYRVEILPLERVVYVCNEEGNASFIFDTEKLDELGINISEPESPENLDSFYKYRLEDLIRANPAIGRRLVQQPNWRDIMLSYLKEPFDNQIENESRAQPRSDFAPKENIPFKKEGWESARSLQKILKVNMYTIKNFAETYRAEHPEWFEKQRPIGHGGLSAEHYHPDLVKIMEEHFSIPFKKEGWESASSLQKILKVDKYTIENFAETYRAEHPEWFEKQRPIGKGLPAEHYHPDLIKIMEEHFSIPFKKEGWESAVSLKKILKVSQRTIKNFAETYRAEHPEWFEKQRPIGWGLSAEHYHPDLVKIMEEYFSIPFKKEGWESASSLEKILKVSQRTIKNFAETYRAEHPEWFEKQRPIGQGLSAEHYHPDLVKIMEEHFSIPFKKEGWESAASLRKILKVDKYTIKNFVETYRAEHPEWFEKQRPIGKGLPAEHYHPDLVKIIEEHFKKRNS